MRKPSTDAKESRANAMRLSSCPGIHFAMSSTGISKFTSSSLYCWSNFGLPRLLSLLPISSRPLLNTGSFRRVLERRTMSMVCASSGEKVRYAISDAISLDFEAHDPSNFLRSWNGAARVLNIFQQLLCCRCQAWHVLDLGHVSSDASFFAVNVLVGAVECFT